MVSETIATVRLSLSHSTVASKPSAIALTGTSVLSSIIIGAVSSSVSFPSTVILLSPIRIVITLSPFTAVMLLSAALQLTSAPSAEKIPRMGTIVLLSIILGSVSNSHTTPFNVTLTASDADTADIWHTAIIKNKSIFFNCKVLP